MNPSNSLRKRIQEAVALVYASIQARGEYEIYPAQNDFHTEITSYPIDIPSVTEFEEVP